MLYPIFMILLIVLAGLFVYFYGNINEMVVGCGGIENFYTGNGFEEDYFNIMNTANFVAGELPKSPLSIWRNESVDCDSISLAIRCISKLYEDVECGYYDYVVVDQTEPSVAHLGVKCRYIRALDNGTIEKGSWRLYY